MTVYRIKDWGRIFENAELRKKDQMPWVKMPTKMAGKARTKILEQDDAAAILGFWYSLMSLASQSSKGERGVLEYSVKGLGLTTMLGQEIAERAVPLLCEIGWLIEHDTFEEALAAVDAERPGPGRPSDASADDKSGGNRAEIGNKSGGNQAENAAQTKTKTKTKKKTNTSTAAPAPVPTPPPEAPPPQTWTGDRPHPKDLLADWDAAYQEAVGEPYARTADKAEAACAKRVLDAVAKTGADWTRIPRAIRAALRDEWARDKGFKVFASQFDKHDKAARNLLPTSRASPGGRKRTGVDVTREKLRKAAEEAARGGQQGGLSHVRDSTGHQTSQPDGGPFRPGDASGCVPALRVTHGGRGREPLLGDDGPWRADSRGA